MCRLSRWLVLAIASSDWPSSSARRKRLIRPDQAAEPDAVLINGLVDAHCWRAYGDVGSIHVRVAAGGDTWDTTTVNTYHAPDPVAWHTGRLAGVTVTHDRSDNADSPVTRVSRFGYAASGLLNSEVVEPGGARALTLTTRYTHDAHGNVTATKRTGYRGVRLPGETEPVTVDRIGRTVFDSAGRYTTATENHYGHTSTVVSRNRHGAVTEARDAVGHRVRTAYGALGRAYWQGDDAGGAKTTIYRDCSRVGCPSGAAYRVRVTAAGGAETLTYATFSGGPFEPRRGCSMASAGPWSIRNTIIWVAWCIPPSRSGRVFRTVASPVTGQ